MLSIFRNTEQVVFQLRYANGFAYLDRCGKILNEIGKSYPEWVIANNISPQGASLVSTENGCVLNFSSSAIDLSLTRDLEEDPISEEILNKFQRQIEEMTTLIIDRLGVTEMLRIGFRMVFCIPMESKEKALEAVKKRNCWHLEPRFLSDLGGCTTSESMTIEFDLDDSSYRLAFQAVERKERVKFGSKSHSIRMLDFPQIQRSKFQDNRKVQALKVGNYARSSENKKWSCPHILMIDIDGFHQDPENVEPFAFANKMTAQICSIGNKLERGYMK